MLGIEEVLCPENHITISQNITPFLITQIFCVMVKKSDHGNFLFKAFHTFPVPLT